MKQATVLAETGARHMSKQASEFIAKNLVDIYQVEREAKGHFFSEGAKKFAKSRIAQTAVSMGNGHYLFVTSEQAPDSPRCWSVREMMPDGAIRTWGKYLEHSTRAQAQWALREAVAKYLSERN